MSRYCWLIALPALWVIADLAERTPVGSEAIAVYASSQGAQQEDALDFAYYRAYVEPLFLKARAQGEGAGRPCATCHTRVVSRLRLQALPPGNTAWTEEQSRQNFQVVAQLVTPGEPRGSTLLLNPLAAEAGGLTTAHTGGKFWQSRYHPDWLTLAAWVEGASTDETAAAVVSAAVAPPSQSLDFEYFKARVQPIFNTKRARKTRCYVCHALGAGEGGPLRALQLQVLSPGATTWNEEQSRLNFEAVSRKVVPGSPEASPLLIKPLRVDTGGGPWHGGGAQFSSTNDPDWQTIAAWVMGATLQDANGR